MRGGFDTLKIVLPKPRAYAGPLLFIIEEISTAPVRAVLNVVMRTRDYYLDEKLVNWFFAATKQWKETAVPLQLLKEVMPPNTVSPKADRVGVWEPINKALERPKGRLVEEGGALYVLLKPITPTVKEQYLTTIDLQRRMFACDCPAYTGEETFVDNRKRVWRGGEARGEEWRKRHVLCKHLLLSSFELSDRILESSPLTVEERAQWKECKTRILQQNASTDQYTIRVLAANYLYFFVKRVLSRMEMHPADYDEESLGRAKEELAG